MCRSDHFQRLRSAHNVLPHVLMKYSVALVLQLPCPPAAQITCAFSASSRTSIATAARFSRMPWLPRRWQLPHGAETDASQQLCLRVVGCRRQYRSMLQRLRKTRQRTRVHQSNKHEAGLIGRVIGNVYF